MLFELNRAGYTESSISVPVDNETKFIDDEINKKMNYLSSISRINSSIYDDNKPGRPVLSEVVDRREMLRELIHLSMNHVDLEELLAQIDKYALQLEKNKPKLVPSNTKNSRVTSVKDLVQESLQDIQDLTQLDEIEFAQKETKIIEQQNEI